MNSLKYNLSIFLFLLSIQVSLAQDTLIVTRPFDCHVTNRSGTILKLKELIKSAKAEGLDTVVRHFKRARMYRTTAIVIGSIGAFWVGYQLGGALVTGRVETPTDFYIGLGLIVVEMGIKLTLSDPYTKKGVKLYNEALYQKKLNRQQGEE